MKFQTYYKGQKFATNKDGTGFFVLDGGAYRQIRGNGQTPVFRTAEQFVRFVKKNIL